MTPIAILEERVHSFLGNLGLPQEQTEDGLYMLMYGSTVVTISLMAEGEETFCRIASIMLADVEPSLSFLEKILKLNTEVIMGAFRLFEDNTLSFSATLLGNYLDFDEFEKTLLYIAQISDDYDDILQELGGGHRAQDLMGSDE